MKNVKLTISYDGTDLLGWQKNSKGASVEGILHPLIEKILQEKVQLQAASRTDAGVHAHMQVVNFVTQKKELDLGQFKYSLNQLIGSNISILQADFAHSGFHPTLDCKEKEYHYYISQKEYCLPEHRLYSWHVYPIDKLDEMKQASKYFIGTKDFSCLCNHKAYMPYENYVRDLYSIDILEVNNKSQLLIKVRGKSFLYKMVRNLVGTLVYVGLGKIKLDDVPSIIESRDRKQAGITAPAKGLFLHSITY